MKLARLLLLSSFSGLAFAAAPAAAPDALPPPAVLTKQVWSALDSCTRKAEREAKAARQLVATGVGACYEQAKARWQTALEQVKDRVGRGRNTNCAATLQEIEQRWITYSSDLQRVKPMSALPLAVEDDIELLLLQHLYDVSHTLSRSSACQPR